MTTKEQASPSVLNELDIEQIERIIWDNRDERTMSIARALERMEERLGRIESLLDPKVNEPSKQSSKTTKETAGTLTRN